MSVALHLQLLTATIKKLPGEAAATVVTKIPTNLKFKRIYDLQVSVKKRPQFGYHGTTRKFAQNILTNGAKKNFSLTGYYEEAVYYAFQRAIGAKQDAVIIKVNLKGLSEDELSGRMYKMSGTPQYVQTTIPLDKNRLTLIAIIPYDIIVADKNQQELTLQTIATQLNLKLTKEGLLFTNTTLSIKNKLETLGWKCFNTEQQTYAGKTRSVYKLRKAGIKIKVEPNVYAKQGGNKITYQSDFAI
jgi:N-acetyl-beta-hexosaminidase